MEHPMHTLLQKWAKNSALLAAAGTELLQKGLLVAVQNPTPDEPLVNGVISSGSNSEALLKVFKNF